MECGIFRWVSCIFYIDNPNIGEPSFEANKSASVFAISATSVMDCRRFEVGLLFLCAF